ncbi:hypothetical protein [Poriferisphaera sp. WC338]|uniref:hypothetical protein n=1 Tax=Poriferisphaera sp. WC338 TaxID=3425129 RepID=UPI003D815A23
MNRNLNHQDIRGLNETHESDLAARFSRGDRWDAHGELVLRKGCGRDYAALGRFHYRAHRPACMTRVLVLEYAGARQDRAGYSIVADKKQQVQAKCDVVADGQIVGVLVESLPALSSKARDYALDKRYSGSGLTAREGVRLLNGEVRCISRVVVHPQWRGLGLAVWLVREALATATTRFTESLAVMGHVNPFFERAGMRVYARGEHEPDARLKAAMSRVGIDAGMVSRIEVCARWIMEMDEAERAWLLREIWRWSSLYMRRYGCEKKMAAMAWGGDEQMNELCSRLVLMRERLFFEPMYYLWSREWA